MRLPGAIAVAAALAVLAAAAPGTAARAGKGQPLRLTIAFTGDVGGYLEPCG